jgi:hypothetical protein
MQFLRWKQTGAQPVWAKTAHAFPTEEQLMEFKRKLGDLLLENRLLKLSQLKEALEVQKRTGEHLGAVLVRLGYVREEVLMPVLAAQLRVDFWRPDGKAAAGSSDHVIPEAVAREHRVVTVGLEGDTTTIAACDPASAPMKEWLGRHWPHPYRLVLAGQAELRAVIEQTYRAKARVRPMLGQFLLESGLITAKQLSAALEKQKISGDRLGQILIAEGAISGEMLERKLRDLSTMA